MRSYDTVPRPPYSPPLSRELLVYLSQSSSVSPIELPDGGGGGGGARSQIFRPRESKALYNYSFTLW
jgi:hypothetical protein